MFFIVEFHSMIIEIGLPQQKNNPLFPLNNLDFLWNTHKVLNAKKVLSFVAENGFRCSYETADCLKIVYFGVKMPHLGDI